jgi:hypothetical protein
MSTTFNVNGFSGSEGHEVNGVIAYRFDFHGGLVRN